MKPRHGRAVVAAILALVIGSIGMLSASAQQQATPVPQSALGTVATPGGTLPNNPQIQLVKVAGGLADPINAASPSDGSGRLFVVERIGLIRIVDKAGNLLPDPFLDISNLVKTDFLEQGLLGLAFHPKYKDNGLFYVYYTDYQTNGDAFLVEFRVSQDDPNKADPKSARVLLTQDEPYVNHNGGSIHFGPDGYLYVALGDGGLAGDPYDNAQRLDTLLGKLLRIDVDTRDAGAYGIPKDNPFANTGAVLPSNTASQMAQDGSYRPAARREICNWGLRNPWQFAFDSKAGDMYLTDVGQNVWEEVNYLPANQPCGWNFGWDFNEGAYCYPPSVGSCSVIGALPVANYDHSQGDCSITGLGVYRGQESPNLDGIYFNSDFCSGRVYGLVRNQDGSWSYQVLLDTNLLATGSGQDDAGNVYLTACTCKYTRTYNPLDHPGGTVWRVVSADKVPPGAETAPTAGAAATPSGEGAAATPSASPVAATPASAASPAAAGQAPSQPRLTMVDVAFKPTALTIPANTNVTINIVNQGQALHNFSITATDDPNVSNLNISVAVPTGQSGTATVNAPPGDYSFVCNVPGHEQEGMFGTLHVQ